MENNIELGSEFNISLNDLTVKDDNLFEYLKDYNTQWYDYARSAIKNIPYSKDKYVLLPEFICESVINCFPKSKIIFYKIDCDFNINIDDLVNKLNDEVGCIYINHYFGYIQKKGALEVIGDYKNKHNILIIEDVTQSLFSMSEYVGDYMVASIRKWMPTPMGAVLFTKSNGPCLPKLNVKNTDNKKAYGMIFKDYFLKTGFDTNEKYREIFVNAETNIDEQLNVLCISDFAKFCISCVSISELKERRKQNLKLVESNLNKVGLKSCRSFDDEEIPLVYPIRINNRNEFRSYLIENKIYCAVHWPFDGFMPESRRNSVYNSKTLISLPIDQRYDNNEILYMIGVINQYGGDLLF